MVSYEVIEEIMVRDDCVSEKWLDYGYVMNRELKRFVFGSGD